MEADVDLMAYADGLLDDDPARKALVEARLLASPEDAARVEIYRAQNAALRRRYGWRVEEPVPEHLYAALERPAGPTPAVLRIVAMLVLMTAAGLSGWWLGQSERADWPPSELLQAARATFSGPGAAGGVTAVGAAAPLNWLSDRVSLSLRIPDLSDHGYRLTGKETVRVADERLVRLQYGRPGGRGFSLFLRPWWEKGDPEIELVRRDDVWLAYWRDGPLASVIAAPLTRAEVADLARAIRRAMHDGNRAAPKVRPEPPPSGLPGMAAPAVPLSPVNERMPDAESGAVRRN